MDSNKLLLWDRPAIALRQSRNVARLKLVVASGLGKAGHRDGAEERLKSKASHTAAGDTKLRARQSAD